MITPKFEDFLYHVSTWGQFQGSVRLASSSVVMSPGEWGEWTPATDSRGQCLLAGVPPSTAEKLCKGRVLVGMGVCVTL